jgi:hypothetical protein
MFFVFYLFPDGRFVPHWTRWLTLFWLVANLPNLLFGLDIFQTPQGLWIGIGLAFSAIGSQVYRYGWRSRPIQRQQTKWVVAVLAVLFLLLVVLAPRTFKSPLESALGSELVWALVGGAYFRLSFLAFPITMTLAILRYRLWDIDVIIRRTVQYTLFTGLLALVYFGGVALLQAIVGRLGGQSSPVIIVLTTLAIAALFNPLRRRVQDFIDRRFYRQKYNTEQALAEFAAAARRETDLEQLSAHLMGTVRETLRPEQVNLWIQSLQRVDK